MDASITGAVVQQEHRGPIPQLFFGPLDGDPRKVGGLTQTTAAVPALPVAGVPVPERPSFISPAATAVEVHE